MRSFFPALALLTLTVALQAASNDAAAADQAPTETSVQLKAGPGRDLTATRCVTCHSLDYIEMNAAVMDRSGWEKSIRKMIDRFGAPVDADDARAILEYLTAHYSSTPQQSK